MLIIAGWKSASLVDVHGCVTFTLWLCGCNLKCPFCHNWKIADNDPTLCKPVKVVDVAEEVEASRFLIDYLHVTGGEPLLQHKNLAVLFEKVKSLGVRCSLNSNLTLPMQLTELLRRGLVDHVATDLKVPPEILYGVPSSASRLWNNFLESLRIIADFGIPLELRIPLHKKLTREVIVKYIDQVVGKVVAGEAVIVLNPLLREPLVNPRDPNWCRDNCGVDQKFIEEIIMILRSYGFSKIHVKSVPGFQQ